MNNKEEDTSEQEETFCYSYEVTMVIQVIARNREEADERLDAQGGYISKRDVVFKDAVALYSGEQD